MLSEGRSVREILGEARAAELLALVEAELTRRRLPGHLEDDTLHLLQPAGTPVIVALDVLARRVDQPGVDAAALVAELFDAQEEVAAGGESMRLTLDNLKVQLRPRAYLDENPSMVWTPWWPGLILVLVADCGPYVRSVAADEVEALGPDRAELERRARQNVWEQNQPRRHRVPGDASGEVMLEGDLFTSTFALWPGRFCEIDPERGVLVAVPTRNCTLLKPVRRGGSQAEVRLFGQWSYMGYTHEAGPVSPSVYWVPGAGDEAGDPEAIELRVTPGRDGIADVTIPRPVKDRLR